MRSEWIKRALAAVAAVGVMAVAACNKGPDPVAVAANAEAGKAFLEKTSKEEGVLPLEGGMYYKVVSSPAPTAPQPAVTDTVKVHYEGTLIDGTKFNSSYDRGVPAAFPLKGLVKAWQIAIPKMHKGDTWMLYVPAEMGYGDQAMGPIPAGSVLVFKIELIDIQPK
ncbi:FKBP-type peptidyl-prolyl cis-trans isomerase [Asticcacaulis sp. ZE23SCel15]|uniref:FKBP-type peptidyl-prolyl cis-trans isomerase n=1 Tax=Asticcacaulis sp. ZE23SCel15 TaxID=3059027 RepID=UPI00265EA285|nr:FKBP-type peptidyl-prolyl cis-trans isomerase [Asticcacaulis sp. ZE23SCel15]WKL57983.1 FKBP-type peptidyl-prolyl cis-trans isomerase [Asticcacaulis sp. ZE23SCel15]